MGGGSSPSSEPKEYGEGYHYRHCESRVSRQYHQLYISSIFRCILLYTLHIFIYLVFHFIIIIIFHFIIFIQVKGSYIDTFFNLTCFKRLK